MPVNIWSAGRNALMEEMARREAQRLQQEALARQAQLDAEARDYRGAQLKLSQDQFAAAQANTETDNARMAAQAEAAERERVRQRHAAEAAHMDASGLVEMYNAAQTPEDKIKIEQQLTLRGIKLPKPEEPKADTRSLQLQAADALAKGDQAAYRRILRTIADTSAAGRAPSDGPAGEKEDLGLSLPVRQYLDSLRTKVDEDGKPYDLYRAYDEVSRQLPKWNDQVRAGARGDRPDGSKIAAYLQKIFPERTEQVPDPTYPGDTITQRTRPGTPPMSQPGQNAPAPSATGPGQMAPPPSAAGPGQMAPTSAPPSYAAIPAWLASLGQPVTPANVAAVAQKFGLQPAAPSPNQQIKNLMQDRMNLQ